MTRSLHQVPTDDEILETSDFSPLGTSGLLIVQNIKAVSAFSTIAILLNISCDAGPGFNISPSISVPQSLTPTPLQKSIPHEPYVDIIPFPAVRDRILSSLAVIDEVQLCMDLQEGAMVVWGDVAWDPLGWEISEDFTQKWWFLIDDQVVRTSNFWRRQRGEKPLTVPFLQFVGR